MKEGEGKIRADSKREGQGGEVGGSFVVVISVSVFTNASAFKLFQFPSISFPKWSKLLRTTRSLRTPVSFAGFSHPTMVAFPENARGKFFATLLDALSPGTLFSLFPSSAPAPRLPNPFLTVSVADVSFVGANETRCERGLKLSPYVHPPRLSLASFFFPPVLPFGRSCQPCRGFGIGPRRLVGSLSRCPSSPCFFFVTKVASRNYVKYLAVSRSFSFFFLSQFCSATVGYVIISNDFILCSRRTRGFTK